MLFTNNIFILGYQYSYSTKNAVFGAVNKYIPTTRQLKFYGLSKYTNPLEEIRLWGAIWTSALFNSQRNLTQLKFILRLWGCLSQMPMQSPVLLASCTRKALPIKRTFGNEDVPLHLGFWQLATAGIKTNSRAAFANISELPIKYKRSRA